MPRLHPDAEFKYVPGGRSYIEERLGIPRLKRPHVTKYNAPARRFHFEQRLWKMKMREDEGFEDFFRLEFLPVYEELLNMGRQELDEETLAFLLLNALPGSWSGFVGVVVASGLDMLPFIEVLIQISLAEAAELELEDGEEISVISKLGFERRMRLPPVKASGKMLDRKRGSGCHYCLQSRQSVDCLSSSMASNLSLRGASADVAPSRVQKSGNRNNNGEAKDEWVVGSGLTFVDANKKNIGKPASRSVQDSRSHPQDSRSHPQDSRSHPQDSRSHPQGSRSLNRRRNEQPEAVWICGSSMTFEDANGRSCTPQAGTHRSQPQYFRTNANRQKTEHVEEVYIPSVLLWSPIE